MNCCNTQFLLASLSFAKVFAESNNFQLKRMCARRRSQLTFFLFHKTSIGNGSNGSLTRYAGITKYPQHHRLLNPIFGSLRKTSLLEVMHDLIVSLGSVRKSQKNREGREKERRKCRCYHCVARILSNTHSPNWTFLKPEFLPR